MRRCALIVLAVLTTLAVLVSGASAKDAPPLRKSRVPWAIPAPSQEDRLAGERDRILWIFDADFDDLSGDNAGWTTYDLSGTPAQANYWHHDTIRIDAHAFLGDTTWWCGRYNPCVRQPRGYGNDWWCQILERTMVEMAVTEPGDLITLEYDQRFAMERDYDYGYVEVSDDGGATWVTILAFTNREGPWGGVPCEWGDPTCGHVEFDLSSYGGLEMDLRFRFASDASFSSEDSASPAVRDGAWQLDNITIKRNGSPIFYDDAESGNMGWVHDDCPASGQTGIVFWRGQYGIDFATCRPYTCSDRPVGSWMYTAVDMFSSTMVTGEHTVLVSPAIDIAGAGGIVGEWDMWVDLPEPTNDIFDLCLASHDIEECATAWPGGYVDEDPGWWYGGPFFGVWTDDWNHLAGNNWLGVAWVLRNYDEPVVPHMGGIFLDRLRVGIHTSDTGTSFQRDIWNSFNDWFGCDMADALTDVARIRVADTDGIAALYLIASNDGGQIWTAYQCVQDSLDSDWWLTPPPLSDMAPRSEVLYYWEATDGVGNASVYPESASNRCFEMSILPITGSIADPTILLVDKHGRRVPGDRRDWGAYDPMGRRRCYSEYYYREALEILGYEWDTYDVEVPSGNVKSDGPDTCGMKYYDTQTWITSDFDAFTFTSLDQWNLIMWLNQSDEGKERNLLVTGNDVGYELIEVNRETLGYYSIWLASEYQGNAVGAVTVDSVPGLEDHAGGWVFMSDDGDPDTALDGDCALAGGCPSLNYLDVVDACPGVFQSEVVAEYCKIDGSKLPAGVAYTHPIIGYQTVNLGFGMELMVDGECQATGPHTHAYYDGSGHFMSAIQARVDLMSNILSYFGQIPDGPGTDVVEGEFKNALSRAAPNPFNPVTKIAFSVKEAGPVKIEVYNVAGRVVRTLLDTELEAGTDGYVTWDGTNDRGERCASGVYFYRIEAPGFAASRKAVLLK